MDITQFPSHLSGPDIVNLFFKAFAIVLSGMYILYTIVLTRQTKVMNQTVQDPGGGIFTVISSLQTLVGILLLILAIMLV